MKRTLLFVLLISVTFSYRAQLVISDNLGGADLAGELIQLSGDPQAMDIEHGLYVTNTSDETLSIKVRRFEEDVASDTYNNICWLICPATPQYAGDNPDWTTSFTVNLDPGETDSSFAIHYDPNGHSECSLFRVQWVNSDNNEEVYNEVFFRVLHGSEDCATLVGVEDLYNDVELSLSPNPAEEVAFLNIAGLDATVDLRVIDVLGQVVLQDRVNTNSADRTRINTSGLRSGIYFVSLSEGQNTIRTIKLVVKH